MLLSHFLKQDLSHTPILYHYEAIPSHSILTVGASRPELVHIQPLTGLHASTTGVNQKNTVINTILSAGGVCSWQR
jgi:hypothetical protein